MDQSKQSPMPVDGVNDAKLVKYASQTYPHAPGAAIIGSVPSATKQTAAVPTKINQFVDDLQLAYQQVQQFHQQQQQQQNQLLKAFWATQTAEIEQTTDFKNQSLPLARVKRIMKADEDVCMISAEAPVVFAKACDLFISELTLRAWIHTEENKRRTVQKNDIAAAITRTDIFDFLVDIIPRDELKDEGLGIDRAYLPSVGATGEPVPYYFVPVQHQVASPEMIMGKPDDHIAAAAGAAATYATQQFHPATNMWQQPQLPLQQQPPQGQNMSEAD